ncbi:MAG: hypothetical protein LBE76_04235 [Nitrososphaerota archaeon]|jgi:hypothetical protein|nr:hypothetical protein [Nitrososphaerota archaeon]
MHSETEMRVRRDLLEEITLLEESYSQLNIGLLAHPYDALVVVSALKTLKASLHRASAFVLTLYTLKGKPVNISWDHLFNHLDYALAAVSGPSSPKQRDTVQAILAVSKAEFDQVLAYFATLKKSIE